MLWDSALEGQCYLERAWDMGERRRVFLARFDLISEPSSPSPSGVRQAVEIHVSWEERGAVATWIGKIFCCGVLSLVCERLCL